MPGWPPLKAEGDWEAGAACDGESLISVGSGGNDVGIRVTRWDYCVGREGGYTYISGDSYWVTLLTSYSSPYTWRLPRRRS